MVSSRSFSALLIAIVTALDIVGAQSHRRPENYKQPLPEVDTQENPEVHRVWRRAATGYVSMGYFPNWAIYAGHNFQPQQLIPEQLTHILYSFGDVSPETGSVFLTDKFADEEKHYPEDSWSEPGNNVYGCLKQMYLMKLKRRNLKVLFSIGGWTYSQAGHFNFVTDAAKRARFVSDSITFIKDYGFDGIDIDFEYPNNAALGQGFANLMTELRTAMNSLASSNGDTVPYQLTAAVAAGNGNYDYLNVPQMNGVMDYWNLMAYDYAGSWLTFADHQANVYGGSRTNVSSDRALAHYKAAGATMSKITFGIPLYGRTFSNTAGIGQPYSGTSGDIDVGVYAYKNLPLAGSQVFENGTDIASYSYDAAKRELISYDTPGIVRQKVDYLKKQGLAGTMFWELSIDKTGSDSLINVANSVLGGLDTTQNHIKYPNSKWDNIKNNMGGGGGGGGTTTANPPGPTGGCGSAAAWTAGAVYTGGQQASYNGRLWQAKWWTQGETPGGASGVWEDKGAC